jgi:two-component system, NtrC family, sensor kinase
MPKALDRSLEGLKRVTVIVRSMKEFAHPDQKEMSAANLNQAILSTLTILRNEYKYVADVETELGSAARSLSTNTAERLGSTLEWGAERPS